MELKIVTGNFITNEMKFKGNQMVVSAMAKE